MWCNLVCVFSLACVGVYIMLCLIHVSVWWSAKAHEHEVYPSCAPLVLWTCARACISDELVEAHVMMHYSLYVIPCRFSFQVCA